MLVGGLVFGPRVADAFGSMTWIFRIGAPVATNIAGLHEDVRVLENHIAQVLGANVTENRLEFPNRGVFGQLDAMNGKLDVIVRSCGGAGGSAVQDVNQNDVRRCVDNCVNTNVRDDVFLNERSFVGCVSRCPSTGGATSCARRYLDFSNGGVDIATIDEALRLNNESGHSSELMYLRELRNALPLFMNSLYACLGTASVNACQEQCESFTTVGEWRPCVARCSNVRFPVAPVGIDASSLWSSVERSTLPGIPVSGGTVEVPVTPRAPVAVDESPVRGRATPRTNACANNCATVRTACIAAAQSAKAMNNCMTEAEACLQACPIK